MHDKLPNRFAGTDGRQKIKSVLVKNQLVAGNEEIADWIIDRAAPVTFMASEVLMKQGDVENDDVLFVVSGQVKITVVGKSRAPVREAPIQVGEMSALNPNDARSATVTANNSEVATLRLAAADFNKLCSSYPELEKRALREQNDRNKAWKNEGTEANWFEKFLSAKLGAILFAALFALVFATLVWQWLSLGPALLIFTAFMTLIFVATMYFNVRRLVIFSFLTSITATIGSIGAPWAGKVMLQGTGFEGILQYGQNLTVTSLFALCLLNFILGVFAFWFWAHSD